MRNKTALYVIAILAILACGPCLTTGIPTSNELTNAANMTFFAETQTRMAVPTTDAQATQIAQAVQATLTAMYFSPNYPPTDQGQGNAATGVVIGEVCYPSDFIPAMTIYAMNTADGAWFSLEHRANTSQYTFSNLPPGDYTLFAYVNDMGGEFGGAYTNAVLCGLVQGCDDHSLAIVHVAAGATAVGIDICDWYGPEGSIPPRP